MDRLHLEPDWQIREDEEGDGRTLEGRIVPYGDIIEMNGGKETFTRGVFADVDPGSVSLLWQHDPHAPIGRMTDLVETDDGAYGTFRLARSQQAREAAEMIRDGVIKGLSVGFEADKVSKKDGIRTHQKARLVETSIVTFAAYPRAEALAVRGEKEGTMEETETPDVAVVDPAPEEIRAELAVVRDEVENGFREIRNHIANLSIAGGAEIVPPMPVREAFGKLLKMVADNPGQNRALADVIGTGTGNAEGLIRNAWLAEIIGYINALRPLFSAAGTVSFPTSGYGIAYPRITQHTTVAKRGAEKTQIPTRELTVAAGTFASEWFAGGVDVSLELISQSDPSVVEVVVGSLMDQYALATETEFAVDTVAAATVGGAVLSFATWAAFSAAIIGTSTDIRAATGVPGDRLALSTASWEKIVGLLNPSQPSISFGAGPDFTAESLNVGGITAFHAPALTADVQFNTKSLRKAEKPPETVTATNVALMGRDIGILGATIAAPFYPAGIVKYTAT